MEEAAGSRLTLGVFCSLGEAGSSLGRAWKWSWCLCCWKEAGRRVWLKFLQPRACVTQGAPGLLSLRFQSAGGQGSPEGPREQPLARDSAVLCAGLHRGGGAGAACSREQAWAVQMGRRPTGVAGCWDGASPAGTSRWLSPEGCCALPPGSLSLTGEEGARHHPAGGVLLHSELQSWGGLRQHPGRLTVLWGCPVPTQAARTASAQQCPEAEAGRKPPPGESWGVTFLRALGAGKLWSLLRLSTCEPRGHTPHQVASVRAERCPPPSGAVRKDFMEEESTRQHPGPAAAPLPPPGPP